MIAGWQQNYRYYFMTTDGNDNYRFGSLLYNEATIAIPNNIGTVRWNYDKATCTLIIKTTTTRNYTYHSVNVGNLTGDMTSKDTITTGTCVANTEKNITMDTGTRYLLIVFE